MDQETYQTIVAQCRQEAIAAGALEPQGLLERMASGTIGYNGGYWSDTPVARQRLAQWTQERVEQRLRHMGFA